MTFSHGAVEIRRLSKIDRETGIVLSLLSSLGNAGDFGYMGVAREGLMGIWRLVGSIAKRPDCAKVFQVEQPGYC